MLLSRMTKSESDSWRTAAGTWMDEREETLTESIARVKASTLTDEDPGEPDLDDEWGDWSDDDGAAEGVYA